jgi:hypothetical protein
MKELTTEQKMLVEAIKLYMEAEHLLSKYRSESTGLYFISHYQTKRNAHLATVTALERVCGLTNDQHQMCWHVAELETFGYIR